ncbi:PREDICTED: non-specific lipid-transfer protein 1 [Tarenaya hassleriana]|uniref:non-specific lipid-transfer protein 1 n=1 Tax=Tarenaya hassleriana TaxID=28532 RepID=UPI00053C37FC|nr:PREDICTED: non-specific lipid-transfer protein 1 [Tarenaya hassleriana]
MKNAFTLTTLFLVLSTLLVDQSHAITCGEVDSSLRPCLPYLMAGGAPTSKCCDGVRDLKMMTPTTADRQTACRCMKDDASRFREIKAEAAAQLPSKCSVEFGVPISREVDCDRIK